MPFAAGRWGPDGRTTRFGASTDMTLNSRQLTATLIATFVMLTMAHAGSMG